MKNGYFEFDSLKIHLSEGYMEFSITDGEITYFWITKDNISYSLNYDNDHNIDDEQGYREVGDIDELFNRYPLLRNAHKHLSNRFEPLMGIILDFNGTIDELLIELGEIDAENETILSSYTNEGSEFSICVENGKVKYITDNENFTIGDLSFITDYQGYIINDIPEKLYAIRDIYLLHLSPEDTLKEMKKICCIINDEEILESNLRLLESEEDDGSPLICIECKGSGVYNDNQENGGIIHCITLISKKRWDFISKIVKDDKEHFDDDNDLYDLFKNCNVIEDLHPEAISFIRKIKNNSFINALMNAIMRLYRPERYGGSIYNPWKNPIAVTRRYH